jgi:hypothetical protein
MPDDYSGHRSVSGCTMEPEFVNPEPIAEEIRRMRVSLNELYHAIGMGHVGIKLKDARFLLGLVLEENATPNNAYQRAHNLRMRGVHEPAPEADVYDGNSWWMRKPALEYMEISRQKLNALAKNLERIAQTASSQLLNSFTIDHILRAKQEVLLARCWLVERIIEEEKYNGATEYAPDYTEADGS